MMTWPSSSSSDHVYLPEGYEPESLNDLVGAQGWPSVIIRKQDKPASSGSRAKSTGAATHARARRASTSRASRSTAHLVRVRGFYIQETEVTIGEFKTYAKGHPDEPGVNRWRGWLETFRREHPDPSKYPAACVDYRLARKYARSVGGMLPDRGRVGMGRQVAPRRNTCLPGATDFTPQNDRLRARLEDPNGNDFGSAPVGKYPKDQT